MKPSQGFSSIEEECEYLDSKLSIFDDRQVIDLNPLLLQLPTFVADPEHPETQQLKIEYEKQYKDILRRYKDKDFLEVTLRQFCSV
jgi:hypothetical protein